MRVAGKALFLGAILAALSSFNPHWSSSLPKGLFRSPASEPRERLHRGHSHNDYQQARPLFDALENRFRSVEADVWLKDGELQVSHLGITFDGSLKDLYLDPLQKLVKERGSVHGDGEPFLLWIDIKDSNLSLVTRLDQLLRSYPMIESGRVSVVLTGNRTAKLAYLNRAHRKLACRDSLGFSENDPKAAFGDSWCWYSLYWFNHFEWDGTGDMPEKELERLRVLVKSVHDKGRKIRFWGAPDTPEVWRTSEQEGVDLIGTNSVDYFNRFF